MFIRLNKYVALKVTTAKSSATEKESAILEHISNRKVQHPGWRHVTTFLDSFEHRGPSGVHRCLVFDVMGPNTSTMFTYLPPNLRPPPGRSHKPSESSRERLPFWMAKSIIRQTLLGIDFLHKSGLVHSDLQPGNILFSVKDLSDLRESDLAQSDPLEEFFVKTVNSKGEVTFQNIESTGTDVQTDVYSQRCIDGEPDPTSPRYIVSKEPLFDYVNLDPPLLIKISDLGGAFFVSEPPAKIVTPLAMRSPELILGEVITQAQDIWSLGCLMFEYLTGRKLFSVMPSMLSDMDSYASLEDDDGINEAGEDGRERSEPAHNKLTERDLDSLTDATLRDRRREQGTSSLSDEDHETDRATDDSTVDDHILQIAAVLGPVPPAFLAKFPRSNIYFNEKGEITKSYIGELPEGYSADYIATPPPIETFLDREQGADLSSEDNAMVKELLRATLRFDPVERPTAEALLAHPWFRESVADIV